MLGPIDLMMPPLMLGMALATMPFTLITCLLTRQTSDLTSWSRFKRAWFKQVYTWFGPASKPLIAPIVEPLLNLAYGTVIEVGPAGGTWMSELAAAARVSSGRIKKIYGVEPNTLFHPELLKAAKSFGLSDIYEPVAAYAQDLEQKGIQKGSIDTIITVHVLCSVGPPTMQETIVKDLYDYLKPGGQWLVYEHVASRHAPIKIWQSMLYIELGFSCVGLISVPCRTEQHTLEPSAGWMRHHEVDRRDHQECRRMGKRKSRPRSKRRLFREFTAYDRVASQEKMNIRRLHLPQSSKKCVQECNVRSLLSMPQQGLCLENSLHLA